MPDIRSGTLDRVGVVGQVEEPVQISDIVAPIQIAGTCGRAAELIHRGLTVADYVHRLSHDGEVWRLGYRWDALASAATAGLLLVTPQSRELDLSYEIEATGLCTIDLFEQPTVTALGTPLWQQGVFRNKNREIGLGLEAAHTYPDGVGAYIDPTVAGLGRSLVQAFTGGTAWKATTPGEDIGTPWITRNGTPYYLRIYNTTQNAIYVTIRLLCVVCGGRAE